MRRVPPALLLLLLIGACEDGGGPPPPAPVADVRAGFPHGAVVDAIQVDAVDRLPLRTAELVAPDGSAAPASSIDVVRDPRSNVGQNAAEGAWRDAVTGDSSIAALTMPNVQAGAALRSQTLLLAIVSSATIPLPDPVAYRRDWARYRIRVTFGTPPDQLETREIAAPEPPPAG
ncbi:MAG TPA: hypothetical protein VGP42_00425 [Stellaceae bacterium]|jgi:hypothetical protein|nr:hypothetical protein [Stellaceae bacterium]